MGMRVIDRTGLRYGRLTVLSQAERTEKGHTQWLCRCDCGNTKIIPTYNLTRIQSCGCYRDEVFKRDHVKHGMCNTKLYRVWSSMKARCKNPNSQEWHRYGGRGITVCEEWKAGYENFFKWAMANGYKEGLTLDRIDNDKGYSPDNCRWATYEEQLNNTSKNLFIEYNGTFKTATQLARENDVNPKMFIQRIKLGWDVERALKEPCHTEFRRRINGRNNTGNGKETDNYA